MDDDADAIDARRRLDRAMTSYVYVCTYDMPGKAYMWLQLFGRGMKRGFMICARILAKKKLSEISDWYTAWYRGTLESSKVKRRAFN